MAVRKKKRRTSSKDPCKRNYTNFIQVVVVLFLIAVIIAISGKIIEKPQENALPETTQIQDFASIEQGTFTGNLKPNYFKEPIDQVIVLFASAKIPGLMLIYYPQGKQLIGGTPQMAVNGINLFDGVEHQIIYSFEKGGQQVIVYDGKPVVSSPFLLYKDLMTGMVAGIPEAVIWKGFWGVDFS